MNILIVSQCSKNALLETRRIVDQFAERRGDRTWHTRITEQGLKTLHKMLRRTARKNTAVACHWLRGKNYSELLWVVGDAARFNAQGATPTNTTTRDILHRNSEDDWHTGQEITLLCRLAAMFHDFGKANEAFQQKLQRQKGVPLADAYRHEWISSRLWQFFAGGRHDEEWLNDLLNGSGMSANSKELSHLRDGIGHVQEYSPFSNLKSLAKAVAWLILSHHRSPAQPRGNPLQFAALNHLPDCIEDYWCGPRPNATRKEIESCWNFVKGLPSTSKTWREQACEIAKAIVLRPSMFSHDFLDNPYVMQVSRMVLMLADHYYSSQTSRIQYGDKDHPLWANTIRTTRALNQRLDEHLVGVSVTAKRIARTLPKMGHKLPRIARHKGFRARSKDHRFRWQDRAFDLAESLRKQASEQGFFGVNMASTGRGKTLANGRILYALADPVLGARFNIALGLRTLTLQTGDVYRDLLGLGSEDMAVLVGGGAIKDLHEHHQINQNAQTIRGSESVEDFFARNQYVHFEGSIEDGPLNRWLRQNPNAQRLLNAPILVCTIDHLMPATEGVRGGRQIAAMLRLMSSDLALDEPDDFGPDDLPALARLVNWAGMLGSRLLLSSATLPPAVVKGLFQAYLEGRRLFQLNRGIPGKPLNMCCAWFDEFNASHSNHAELGSFAHAHEAFVRKRVTKLAKQDVYRRAEIQPVLIPSGTEDKIFWRKLSKLICEYSIILHERHHGIDPTTRKRVSVGLIRMANIDPLVETAIALYNSGAPDNYFLHLCVYHSQHPLLVRSDMEQVLDSLLNRKDPFSLFQHSEIRKALDGSEEENHLFIIMATPVAEVGRDHDYDWAVVEPSSMRSIIQLAGRVRRHRTDPCSTPNLILLDVNVNHLKSSKRGPAYCRPGFESEHFPLESHHLTQLFRPGQLDKVDATSRIQESACPEPRTNLADLEHERLNAVMIGGDNDDRPRTIPVHWWWTTRAHLCGELQREQPFRFDSLGRQRFILLPDEDSLPHFHRVEDDGTTTSVDNLLHRREVYQGPRMAFWGEPDYIDALEKLAVELNMETDECAFRFGGVELPARGTEQGWYYTPALGFSRFK